MASSATGDPDEQVRGVGKLPPGLLQDPGSLPILRADERTRVVAQLELKLCLPWQEEEK